MLLWSLLIQIMVCEFNEWVSCKYELFNKALLQCDWYLFPIEMRRMYVLIMMNAQQPTLIQGFGNFPCTRETLTKVIAYDLMIENCSVFTIK